MPSVLRASCLLLPFLVILSMLVVSSEARLSLVFSTLPNITDGHLFFRKLGFLVPKNEFYRRRFLIDVNRTAPGGPDPQHH
ncbi:CLAVATA3/ESR (CLE)-related protein 6-like [Malus sylvestris]|uniref:CLAVATA3/ESR (CLE)-related protein 6-like n=1 Tax=Malus domestica TaxID=3750 RepID=UPI0010AADC6E|nr:CLAVATA3/ESR (CLE)-related protein 6-like [Malus domestica]XP_050111316.1 CLAVATA3/ESR (CLE)-related protein 6-like [Malus sylvestris]